MKRSTFLIIGDRYLDAQHDDEYIASLELELRARRTVGVKRWVLEYISESSLWWNYLWWEWDSLDGKDIKIGWVQNIAFFSMVGLICTYIFGIVLGLLSILILHLITVWMGLTLRSGTKLRKV